MVNMTKNITVMTYSSGRVDGYRRVLVESSDMVVVLWWIIINDRLVMCYMKMDMMIGNGYGTGGGGGAVVAS